MTTIEQPRAELIGYAAVLAAQQGETMGAADSAAAKRMPDRTKRMLQKAATDPGSVSDPAFAGSLADFRAASGGFLDGQSSFSIFDRLVPDARRAARNSRSVVQSAYVTGSVVQETAPGPTTALSFDTVTNQSLI